MPLEAGSNNPAVASFPPATAARAVADVFDQSGAYFFCFDEGGRFVQANSAFAALLGCPPDQIERLTFSDVTAGDGDALLARLARGETIISAELNIRTGSGELVAVSGMLSPRVEAGRLVSALGMFKGRKPPVVLYTPAPQRSHDPELVEALVEYSPDGAAITDAGLEIVAFNRNFLEIWGLDEDSVRAGHGLAAALRIVEDPDAFRDAIRAFHADLESRGGGVVRLTDGRVLDWQTTVAFDRQGGYLGRVWYYRDATTRLRMEADLRRNEELYRQLATHFPDGAVFLYDHNLTILLADGSGLSDIRLSRQEIVGRPLAAIMPRRLVAEVEPALRAALAGERAARDVRLGSRTYSLTAVPLSTHSEQPARQGMAIVQDVSSQRRLEAQLRKTEARLRALVEQIPAVTYVQHVRGHENVTVFMSPQVEDFFGYTPEELLDGSVGWLDTVHPDDRAMVLAGTLSSNADSRPFAMEYRALTRWGTARWVRDEATVIRDERGKAHLWQGIIVDITEERELEEAVRASEERFRSAFDEAPMGIVMLGLDGSPRRINDAMCAMLGYTEDELLAPGALDALVDPDDLQLVSQELTRLRAGEVDRFRMVMRFTHRAGHTVWAQLDVSYVFSVERNPEYILAQAQDISEKHRLEEELRQSEAVFRSAFDHAAIGMARVAPDGSWLDVNPALCRMLGYSREELVQLDTSDLVFPEDLDADLEHMAAALRGEQTNYYLEKRVIHSSGATLWVALSVSLVRAEEDGRPLFFIVQVQDITARKDLEAKLEYQANHDGLTGLLNRHGLMRLLESPRGRDEDRVGILVIDMDGFKEINDLYGHAAGDLVLQEVARRIAGCVRETDQVARLGGDEFVVTLDGGVTRDVVERLGARIEAAVARPIVVPGRGPVTVGASVGTDIGPRGMALTKMLKTADDAMYRAKRLRRSA